MPPRRARRHGAVCIARCPASREHHDGYSDIFLHMSLSVLLFASYADAFGARRLEVPVTAPCAVTDIVEALRAMPGGTRLPADPLVAVNRSWVPASTTVVMGDEVAIIPPVAGG